MAVLGRRAGWVLGLAALFACGSRTSLDLGEYAPSCKVGHCASGGTSGYGAGGSSGSTSGFAGTLAVGGMPGGGHPGSVGGFAGGAGCGYTHATGTDPTIDDMLDGDSFIAFAEGRQGSWYAYNDGTGMQYPPPGTLPMTYFSKWSAYTHGGGFYSWGAAIGLVLENGCPYDASVYRGISFTIVNDAPDPISLSLQVATAATTPIGAGGTCDATRDACYDAFQLRLDLDGGSRVGDIVGFENLKQQGWGTPVNFDPSKLISISFQAPINTNFAFYIEKIAFW